MKCNYFYYVVEIYNQIKVLCETLKFYDRDPNSPKSRISFLKNSISSLNLRIFIYRKENENYLPASGLILPFDTENQQHEGSQYLIVKILKEEAFCFSTKARVPTKMSVECIKINDCDRWDDYYLPLEDETYLTYKDEINKNNSNSDSLIENTYNIIDKNVDIVSVEEVENAKEKTLKKFYENLQKSTEELKDIKENYDIVTKEELQQIIETPNPFGKNILEKEKEIHQKSPFRNFPSYKIFHFIAKADDDLRQEQMILQIIKKFKMIFEQSGIPLKLKTYSIETTSNSSGLIEFLPNTNSIDGIKKLIKKGRLIDFYKDFFKNNFDEAQINFTQSLAAYSLISYILQIKDRHNGNILIDSQGHIIHIDFGFVLGISPGNLNFESAPFKMTDEYIEIMDLPHFTYFKTLILRGFLELKKHRDYLVNLISIMSNKTKMPCFNTKNGEKPEVIINKLKERFHMYKSEQELKLLIDDLVEKSKSNFWTNRYDSFQYITNGIRY